MNEWISVEDGLPKLNQEVLCFQPKKYGVNGKTFEPRVLQGYLFEQIKEERYSQIDQDRIGDNLHSLWAGGQYWSFPYICHQNFVTHWMPLPDPPE